MVAVAAENHSVVVQAVSANTYTYDPAVTLLGVFQKGLKAETRTDASVCQRAHSQRRNCLPTDVCTNKIRVLHTMGVTLP